MVSKFVLTTFGVVCLACLSSCSAPEVVLNIHTEPSDAEVYISRRGQKVYKGKIGPVKGDMSDEKIIEDFVLLGHTPLEYCSPLEERESGATFMGVGVAVDRKYAVGVLRIEKDGYETIERRVRFKDGEVEVKLKLNETSSSVTSPQAVGE